MKITATIKVYPKEYYEFFKNECGITYYDTFLLAGIVGFMQGLKNENADYKNMEFGEIPRNVIINNLGEIQYYSQIIYLMENRYELSENDLFHKMFEENDETEVNFNDLDRIQLFKKYAEGGIQYLYDNTDGLDDMISSLADKVSDFITDLLDNMDEQIDID